MEFCPSSSAGLANVASGEAFCDRAVIFCPEETFDAALGHRFDCGLLSDDSLIGNFGKPRWSQNRAYMKVWITSRNLFPAAGDERRSVHEGTSRMSVATTAEGRAVWRARSTTRCLAGHAVRWGGNGVNHHSAAWPQHQPELRVRGGGWGRTNFGGPGKGGRSNVGVANLSLRWTQSRS